MPLCQHNEQSSCMGQVYFKITPDEMPHTFKSTNQGKHLEGLFYNYLITQGYVCTEFHITGISFCSLKAKAAQNDHFLFVEPDQWLVNRIMHIGPVQFPIDGLTDLIKHQAVFTTHGPAPIIGSFSSK